MSILPPSQLSLDFSAEPERSKRCSRCQEEKSVSAFYRRSAGDGYQNYCKACSRQKVAQWNAELDAEGLEKRRAAGRQDYHEHRAERIAKVQARYQADPSKHKKTAQEWAERNRDKRRESNKLWYEQNSEQVRAAQKAWRERNPEKAKAAQKSWRERNPEKVKAWHNRWMQRNPELIREYCRQRRALRNSVPALPVSPADLTAKFAYWGDCCWVCRGEAEAVDHVKPLSKGGSHMLCNLRPICNSCNSAKYNHWPYRP